MAFKVLLGLLAAVGVTGGAVYYGTDSGHCSGGCPLTASVAADTTTCYPPEDLAAMAEGSSCCAGKIKPLPACSGAAEEITAGGDAMAALTGGVALGR